jgi:hypothetical protein
MQRSGLWRHVFITALALGLFVGAPMIAGAEQSFTDTLPSWGVTVWGASYHFEKDIDYEKLNWGAGLRRYVRPHWKWLGENPQTRILFEGDALRNSNGGLMVAASVGPEVHVASLWGPCRLFGTATVTAAYYENPRTNKDQWKAGPVPGLTVGCGAMKINGFLVVRPSSQPVAALASSITIVF